MLFQQITTCCKPFQTILYDNQKIFNFRVSDPNPALWSSPIRSRSSGRWLRRSRNSPVPDMSISQLLRVQVNGDRRPFTICPYLPGKAPERVPRQLVRWTDQTCSQSSPRHIAKRDWVEHQGKLSNFFFMVNSGYLWDDGNMPIVIGAKIWHHIIVLGLLSK